MMNDDTTLEPDMWLLTADVAGCYGWTIPYVRKLAHRHQWRRIRIGQGVAYHAADIDAYYDQHGRPVPIPTYPEPTNPYRNRGK